MSFTYFTDRDLGTQFPQILLSAGLAVERHADHFDPETPDVVWLQEIASRGWIAISHDKRIRYKPNERDAVIRCGVALLLVIGHAPYAELAENFVATRVRIERFLNRFVPPFIAKVYRPVPGSKQRAGRIELWYQPGLKKKPL